MYELRIFFKKQGMLKYISHLDLNRFMSRVLKRSGLPVWRTEGFSPHIYVTFALPLSLGQCSECESMNFRLTDDNITPKEALDALKAVLPPELEPYKCAIPVYKAGKIGFSEYSVRVYDTAEKLKETERFFGQNEINVSKRTKRGEKTVDLKEFIENLKISTQNNDLLISMRLPAGTENSINPSLVLSALDEYLSYDAGMCEITRTAVLTLDGKLFE